MIIDLDTHVGFQARFNNVRVEMHSEYGRKAYTFDWQLQEVGDSVYCRLWTRTSKYGVYTSWKSLSQPGTLAESG
jgi:hypothetical protein